MSDQKIEWCTNENPCEECRKLRETTRPLPGFTESLFKAGFDYGMATKSPHKTPPTPPTTPEHDSLRLDGIAFRVAEFFVQLLDTDPEIIHSYLLHLSISQLDHPTLRSKVDDLLHQLERHAKKPDQSAGRLGFRWVQGDETEPSDSDKEGG